MQRPIFTLAILIVLLSLGALLLHAITARVLMGEPAEVSKTSPLSTGAVIESPTATNGYISSTGATNAQPLLESQTLLTTTTHSIDWTSISPSAIVGGSQQLVTITAQISDPAVIRNSVNLLYTSPTGTVQVIGSLNDNGVDGDAVPNDNIFTMVTSFVQYPVGPINLRISAAFAGSLLRTQTGQFQLNVLPTVTTAGWVTLTDSQNLFSVEVPPNWNLVVSESPGDDPSVLKNVYFEFPDGTVVFTISVNATSSLEAIQTGNGPQPVFLGANGQYVFGESDTQSVIGNEAVPMSEIAQVLPQILATFKIL